jgi:hypothetical protein
MRQSLNKYLRKLDAEARLGLPRVVGAADGKKVPLSHRQLCVALGKQFL